LDDIVGYKVYEYLLPKKRNELNHRIIKMLYEMHNKLFKGIDRKALMTEIEFFKTDKNIDEILIFSKYESPF